MKTNIIVAHAFLSLALVSLLGCAGQLSSSGSPKPRQGKATWVDPNAPQPERPVSQANKDNIKYVDAQQVARDTDILVSAPGEDDGPRARRQVDLSNIEVSVQDKNESLTEPREATTETATTSQTTTTMGISIPVEFEAEAPAGRARAPETVESSDVTEGETVEVTIVETPLVKRLRRDLESCKSRSTSRITRSSTRCQRIERQLNNEIARLQRQQTSQQATQSRDESRDEVDSDKKSVGQRVGSFFGRIFRRGSTDSENNQIQGDQAQRSGDTRPTTGSTQSRTQSEADKPIEKELEVGPPEHLAGSEPSTSDEQLTLSQRLDKSVRPDVMSEINEVRAELHLARLNQMPYREELVKQYIDLISKADETVTETITYGNTQRRSVTLVDESPRFVAALKAILATSGVARVPMIDEQGNVSNYVDLPIGGDLIPEIEGKTFVDANGNVCTKVICVLSNIHRVKQEEKPLPAQFYTTSEEAAYDILFVYFFNRYIITGMVPRLNVTANPTPGFITEEEYQRRKSMFRALSAEQVRLFAETLWILPPTYDRMSSLLYVMGSLPRSEQPASTSADSSSGNGASTASNTGTQSSGTAMEFEREGSHAVLPLGKNAAGHFHLTGQRQTQRGKINYSMMGYIVLDASNFAKLRNDRIVYVAQNNVETTAGGHKITRVSHVVRPMTELEILYFEPDVRERQLYRDRSSIIHELTHALDRSELALELSNEEDMRRREQERYYDRGGIANAPFISYLDNWISLSQWTYDPNASPVQIPAIEYGQQRGGATYNSTKGWTTPMIMTGFVDTYGARNPVEDLAVHAEGYTLKPNFTKQTTPDKYAYLERNVFSFVARGGQSVTFKYNETKFLADKYGFAYTGLQFQNDDYYANHKRCKYNFEQQRFMVFDGCSTQPVY